MDYIMGMTGSDRYKRLRELVYEHLTDNFYIYEILGDMEDCRGNYMDEEIISCLDDLVSEGVLKRHFAKYKKTS